MIRGVVCVCEDLCVYVCVSRGASVCFQCVQGVYRGQTQMDSWCFSSAKLLTPPQHAGAHAHTYTHTRTHRRSHIHMNTYRHTHVPSPINHRETPLKAFPALTLKEHTKHTHRHMRQSKSWKVSSRKVKSERIKDDHFMFMHIRKSVKDYFIHNLTRTHTIPRMHTLTHSTLVYELIKSLRSPTVIAARYKKSTSKGYTFHTADTHVHGMQSTIRSMWQLWQH